MTDRNTISQVIESLFEDWIENNKNIHPLAVENMKLLETDALAMLKEQGVVEPITEHHLFLCPVCKNTLFREQKFCHECGKRIEWECW